MTRVKICGINTEDAFDAVVEAGADYLGFVFFPPSPRFVTPARAAALSARHPGGPKLVGLFVDPKEADLHAALAQINLDILQIYAGAARCQALAAEVSTPIWRAIGVATAADLPGRDEKLAGYVIEAKAPPGANRPGGNATAMDWSLLSNWRSDKFWLLAGGLTPANVPAAIAQSGAPGVDVSSGVETAPGVKSPVLIRNFIHAARQAGGGDGIRTHGTA